MRSLQVNARQLATGPRTRSLGTAADHRAARRRRHPRRMQGLFGHVEGLDDPVQCAAVLRLMIATGDLEMVQTVGARSGPGRMRRP